MKPIRIVLTPTRNRPLNLLLGAMLMLVAALLLLSLSTYHPSDSSLSTSTGVTGPHAVRNLIGPTGAYLSDLLLQIFGLTAFGLPLWIGGLGLTWTRSRNNGAAWLRWTGVILTLAALPTVLGMLPWHWRWLHVLPIEGVTGRLLADLLMGYLNLTGAAIVACVVAAGGLYLGSNFSFRSAWEWSQERSIQLTAWHDRWQNWRADRADARAEKEAIREAEMGPEALAEDEDYEAGKVGLFSRIFGFMRRRRPSAEDLLDDVPAVQRIGHRTVYGDEDEVVPASRTGFRTSIWERRAAEEAEMAARPPAVADAMDAVPISGRVNSNHHTAEVVPMRRREQPRVPEVAEEFTGFAAVDMVAPSAPTASAAARARAEAARAVPAPMPAPVEALPIHEREDVDLRTETVAPKRVDGFKLPPSTLLTRGEEPLEFAKICCGKKRASWSRNAASSK